MIPFIREYVKTEGVCYFANNTQLDMFDLRQFQTDSEVPNAL